MSSKRPMISCIPPCLSGSLPVLPIKQFQCSSDWRWPFYGLFKGDRQACTSLLADCLIVTIPLCFVCLCRRRNKFALHRVHFLHKWVLNFFFTCHPQKMPCVFVFVLCLFAFSSSLCVFFRSEDKWRKCQPLLIAQRLHQARQTCLQSQNPRKYADPRTCLYTATGFTACTLARNCLSDPPPWQPSYEKACCTVHSHKLTDVLLLPFLI